MHRDIKPGNLIVDKAGTVKILDLGLARFFHEENESITQKYDETVLGTADYLAPEQILDSHSVDIRADIYSLGTTLYYCLAGKAPFAEGTIPQKLIWHQTRQPKSIRRIRPEVPAALELVLFKMMAKDPNERYQDPKEVVAALASCFPAAALSAPVHTGQRSEAAGSLPQAKAGAENRSTGVQAQTTRTASLPGANTPRPRRPVGSDSDSSSIETKEIYANADTEHALARASPSATSPQRASSGFINSGL